MTLNPILAGALSLIVPGLGQFFSGRRYRGAAILLSIAVMTSTVLWYGKPIWYIVPIVMWLWNVWDAARTALRVASVHRPDVIVSSGPPHSAHEAARRSAENLGIPWVMDMRDPWAGLPSAYDAIFRRALAKDPAQRYQSAEQLVEVLTAWKPPQSQKLKRATAVDGEKAGAHAEKTTSDPVASRPG